MFLGLGGARLVVRYVDVMVGNMIASTVYRAILALCR